MSKNKKLLELFRKSGEPNFMKFLEKLEAENGVIYAGFLFDAKKKDDEEWGERLERINNIDKPKEDGESKD